MTDQRKNFSEQLSGKRKGAGRQGRGGDAFSRRESREWSTVERRIGLIVERENRLRMVGGGFDVIHDYRHVLRRTLKAIRF